MISYLVFSIYVSDGFFLEAGGKDFEDQSTSLYFELNYGWKVRQIDRKTEKEIQRDIENSDQEVIKINILN